ncbi:MAG: ABC transporter permease [Lentisphaeria bacterium]|nr:ABC transporter permease [Lentisphaeria bacterium]
MENKFSTIIEPRSGFFNWRLREVWAYRDLALLFVKRNFTSQYKQTILGPAWAVLQPLLTTVVFTLVFGKVAKLSPQGINGFVYYLCATVAWTYFSSTLAMISSTFTANSHIFSKVYFPRLVLPLSTAITGLIALAIQFSFFLVAWGIYLYAPGSPITPNYCILLLPLLILQMGLLAMGSGIIVSALTTKYRDLTMLVGFGVQLWMYATPVAYSASIFSQSRYYQLYWCNPMTPIIETLRYAFLGPQAASFKPEYLLISAGTTLVMLLAGMMLFSKVERTFMDVV